MRHYFKSYRSFRTKHVNYIVKKTCFGFGQIVGLFDLGSYWFPPKFLKSMILGRSYRTMNPSLKFLRNEFFVMKGEPPSVGIIK